MKKSLRRLLVKGMIQIIGRLEMAVAVNQYTRQSWLEEAWVSKEGSFVVGADLADDEGAFPLTPELAWPLCAASVPLTLKAGEWSSGDATMAVNAGVPRDVDT